MNLFQGMNVKNKVPILLEVLDNYDLQNLVDFFEGAQQNILQLFESITPNLLTREKKIQSNLYKQRHLYSSHFFQSWWTAHTVTFILTTITLSPREKLNFSKMITVYQKTTSNIPVKRYCLGYVLNHHNRHQDVTN